MAHENIEMDTLSIQVSCGNVQESSGHGYLLPWSQFINEVIKVT